MDPGKNHSINSRLSGSASSTTIHPKDRGLPSCHDDKPINQCNLENQIYYNLEKQAMSKSSADCDRTDKNKVEISSNDGTVTIVVTPEEEGSDGRRVVPGSRRLMSRSPGIASKKGKRRARARRELEERRRKWLAREKRALFGASISNQSSSRLVDKIKPNSSSCPRNPENISFHIENKDKENVSEIGSSSLTELSNKSLQFERNDSDLTSDWNRHSASRTQDTERKIKFPAISPLSLFTLPPVKEKEKQTRTTLTLEEKVKVIEAFLDGKSQRQIAHMYGIGKTQVSGIIKRREEILAIYRDSLLRGEKLTMKRQRKSEYAGLNEHLIQWYRHMTVVAGVKITTGMLRAKALQIAPELGYQDFKASNGWLATFKANNNLKFSRNKKCDNYEEQNYQMDCGHAEDDDEDGFFDEGDADDNNGQQVVPPKSLPGPGNHGVANPTDASHLGHVREAHAGPSSLGQVNVLSNPGLIPSALTKSAQMPGAALTTNLAATAYNLSREHARDLGRSDGPSHLGDLHHGASINAAPPLNHSAAGLSVTRTVVDNNLPKPSDTALSYKSEDPLGYGYDPQARMNDAAAARGSEYNYAPYGFAGSYYGYHFLGQY